MTSTARTAAAALVVTLVAAGCSGARARSSPTEGPADSTRAEEFEALYLARLDSARANYSEADVRFMTDMIHHHAQALEMASMVPARTQNEQIRTLAARINNAQKDEIAIMRRWLRDRGEPVPPVAQETTVHEVDPSSSPHVGMDQGAMDHSGHHTSMPGMLTSEELARLESARGAEFDRLFLSSMIRHHQGAVTMVRELFATDGAVQDDQAFKFASDAQVDQATEVARMQSMLAELTRHEPAP